MITKEEVDIAYCNRFCNSDTDCVRTDGALLAIIDDCIIVKPDFSKTAILSLTV